MTAYGPDLDRDFDSTESTCNAAQRVLVVSSEKNFLWPAHLEPSHAVELDLVPLKQTLNPVHYSELLR